MHSYSYLVLHF